MHLHYRWALLALGLSLASAPAWAATYKVDPDHTALEFKVRHLLSKVRGYFTQFEGEFEYEPGKPEVWRVKAVAQTASINTRVEQRDNHLRSADFFEVERFSTMTFESTEVTEATETSAKLHGLLTIRDVQKPVVFDLTIHGLTQDPWGNKIASFSATTTINRKDFGLVWNKTVETGQLFVGEEVEIVLEVEGLEQAPTSAP